MVRPILYKTIIVLAALCCFAGCAASGSEDAAFLKEYNEFRYSLYDFIVENEIDMPGSLHKWDARLVEKAKTFFETNEDNIYSYQKRTLKKLEAEWQPGEIYDDYTDDFFAIEDDFTAEIKAILNNGGLMYTQIDPLYKMKLCVTSFLSKGIWGFSPDMLNTMKIGGTRIAAANESGSRWNVIIDSYFFAVDFSFDVETQLTAIEKVYVHNKLEELLYIGGSPEQVAERFLTAVKNMDFQFAIKYSTKETVEILKMMESLIAMANEDDLEEAKNAKLEILGSEIDGDRALVYYSLDGTEEILEVHQSAEGWKAHFPKDM